MPPFRYVEDPSNVAQPSTFPVVAVGAGEDTVTLFPLLVASLDVKVVPFGKCQTPLNAEFHVPFWLLPSVWEVEFL